MVRKGKGKNRKGNPKQQEAIFGSSSYNVDSDSDEEIPFHVSSRYSAKAVNCTACLKPKDGHRRKFI